MCDVDLNNDLPKTKKHSVEGTVLQRRGARFTTEGRFMPLLFSFPTTNDVIIARLISNIDSNLLAHDADVRAKDRNGRTALHQACRAADCFAVEVSE